MLRSLLFQTHWLIGISFGLILAVVGFTGGLLSFEQEIIKALNADVMSVEVPQSSALTPSQLLSRLQENTGKSLSRMTLSSDAHDAIAVQFDGAKRGETDYINPYTGELLGQANNGRDFMRSARSLHRWLLMDISIGRPIVGVATALLILMAISGIYLRWPKQVFSLRQWLSFNWRKKGHSFWWHLHAVLGTWVFFFYLLAAGTGLWWSFDWYRAGLYQLAGVEQPQRFGPPRGANGGGKASHNFDQNGIALDTVWQNFLQESHNNWQQASLSLPQSSKAPVSIRYLPSDAPHERAANQMVFNAHTGELIKAENYQDKSTGEKFMASIFPLHAGSFFGFWGTFFMMIASLAMPVFAVSGWILYLKRRRQKRLNQRLKASIHTSASGNEAWLIAYASQTGTAENIAWQTAKQLQTAQIAVHVKALNAISPEQLAEYRQALFIVSSFGDGQAPDNARLFQRKTQQAADLSALNFAVLGLGDKHYEHFCGFARHIQQWLEKQGATALFQPIYKDVAEHSAVTQWQRQINQLTGQHHQWQDQEASSQWQLLDRQCLNPNGVGAPVWLITFKALQNDIHWQAGDLVSLTIANQRRDYSIASINHDGTIELLVRQVRHPDGKLGLGSAFLLQHTQPGDKVSLILRNNRHFHNQLDKPAIFIGNGTGLAGLMAHLRQRQQNQAVQNWLIFGERQAAHDFYYQSTIEQWLADGHIQKLSLAFSQDQAEKVYVQHLLEQEQETLRQWLANDAVIYVCGSLDTMAKAVDDTLRRLLGEAAFEQLIEQGRYQRDIY